MSKVEINSLDDIVQVLSELDQYEKYNYIRDHLTIKNGNTYINNEEVKIPLSSFLTMKHITENSFHEFGADETNLSNKILEVQLAASIFLLDETYKPVRNAINKLAKIGFKIIKSDLPEFGELVLQGKEFRIYFDI